MLLDGNKKKKRKEPERLWKKLPRSSITVQFKKRKQKSQDGNFFALLFSILPSLLGSHPPFFSPASWDRFTWDASYGKRAARPFCLWWSFPVDKITDSAVKIWACRCDISQRCFAPHLVLFRFHFVTITAINLWHINLAHVQCVWIIKFLSHYAPSLYGTSFLAWECT